LTHTHFRVENKRNRANTGKVTLMRSIDPADFQHVPHAVAVMARSYPSLSHTGQHSHERAQLLFAISGLMIARTSRGTWVIPPGHALMIAKGVMHDIEMHGDVEMRTAYLVPDDNVRVVAEQCRVILVSPLLDAALQALADEPVLYDPDGRGPHLAALIMSEIARAPATPFALPLPDDARLRKLCEALLNNPAIDFDIDTWGLQVGVSRRTLTRRFRTETGLSFGEWRRRLRLLHTLMKQAEGSAPKDVARRVGYRSTQALQAMMRRLLKSGAEASDAR
jgi:AraC-like DNA-binding protein